MVNQTKISFVQLLMFQKKIYDYCMLFYIELIVDIRYYYQCSSGYKRIYVFIAKQVLELVLEDKSEKGSATANSKYSHN